METLIKRIELTMENSQDATNEFFREEAYDLLKEIKEYLVNSNKVTVQCKECNSQIPFTVSNSNGKKTYVVGKCEECEDIDFYYDDYDEDDLADLSILSGSKVG